MKRLIALLFAVAALPAHALYKCEINGKTEYRDQPCPTGKAQAIKVDPMNPTAEDAAYSRMRGEIDVARQGFKRQVDVDGRLRSAARTETKTSKRNSVRCDQMRRSAQFAQDRASASPDNGALLNRAIDLRQNYQVECE